MICAASGGLLRQLRHEQIRIARRGWLVLAVFVLANFTAYTFLDLIYRDDDQAYALLNFVVWAAGYVLMVALMQRAGYLERGKPGGPGTYFVLGLAYGTAVLIGFALLIVPGLYLMMRWLVAYPVAVTSGGIVGALKRSWRMTAHHQKAICLAMLGPIGLYGVALGLPLLVLFDADLTAAPILAIANLAFALGWAWLTILEIAAFGVLADFEAAADEPAREQVPA